MEYILRVFIVPGKSLLTIVNSIAVKVETAVGTSPYQ